MVNQVCATSAVLALFVGSVSLHGQTCKSDPLPHRADWPVYGGQVEGDHYSPLSQINRSNGPIVTAGNVLFIGATAHDKKFRAFDSRSGKLLWEVVLPFAGTATPATYMVEGRQYVVIASGGTQFTKGPTGSVYIAFSLQ